MQRVDDAMPEPERGFLGVEHQRGWTLMKGITGRRPSMFSMRSVSTWGRRSYVEIKRVGNPRKYRLLFSFAENCANRKSYNNIQPHPRQSKRKKHPKIFCRFS